MKIKIDRIANAAYITLRKDEIHKTIRHDDDWLFDVNQTGDIVGIEILNYSKHSEDIA